MSEEQEHHTSGTAAITASARAAAVSYKASGPPPAPGASKEEILAYWEGVLRLNRPLRRGGRPSKRPPDFRARYARWAAWYEGEYRQAPTPYHAEGRFAVSRKTITRWLGEPDT